jgi:hypothetical protein
MINQYLFEQLTDREEITNARVQLKPETIEIEISWFKSALRGRSQMTCVIESFFLSSENKQIQMRVLEPFETSRQDKLARFLGGWQTRLIHKRLRKELIDQIQLMGGTLLESEDGILLDLSEITPVKVLEKKQIKGYPLLDFIELKDVRIEKGNIRIPVRLRNPLRHRKGNR